MAYDERINIYRLYHSKSMHRQKGLILVRNWKTRGSKEGDPPRKVDTGLYILRDEPPTYSPRHAISMCPANAQTNHQGKTAFHRKPAE